MHIKDNKNGKQVIFSFSKICWASKVSLLAIENDCVARSYRFSVPLTCTRAIIRQKVYSGCRFGVWVCMKMCKNACVWLRARACVRAWVPSLCAYVRVINMCVQTLWGAIYRENAFLCESVCVCVCVCMRACAHARTRVCACARMYAHVYAPVSARMNLLFYSCARCHTCVLPLHFPWQSNSVNHSSKSQQNDNWKLFRILACCCFCSQPDDWVSQCCPMHLQTSWWQ